MALLGWVIRILLFLLVLRAVVRLVAGLLQGLQGGDPRRPVQSGVRAGRTPAVALVKDPVCGTYVVAEKALTAVIGGKTHHFCSDKCRLAFERRQGASRTA